MKKFFLASVALLTLTGAASAADLAARPYTKAPMVAPVAPSWTGFYIFGGAGGGLWDADSNVRAAGPGGIDLTRDQRYGGDGWFGTVGAGYDWQFNNSWVAGVFADGQFGSIRGSLSDSAIGIEGREKLRTSYAAGVRLGYLVAPNVYSYVNAGYTGSEWSGSSLSSIAAAGGPALTTTNSFHRDGWFVGGGVENNLNIFGIAAPGWFMKTEYRSAFYDRVNLAETCTAAGAAAGCGAAGALAPTSVTFKPWVQTISTSLVYRFNWTGPLVAKY